MPVFRCEKYPSLLVVGVGKFSDGALKVEGAAADRVRWLVGNTEFGVTEDAPSAPRRGRPPKIDS